MKRILVCDDDHEIVQAICVYLTDAGFEIVRAYSGKEALQCVLDPDQQIDLIIMDVMMPEVNGIEATKKIRELYNIPIIMLSAKSEDEDKITGLKIGADDYMTKPFNPEELVARVESQLRRIEMICEGKNKRSNVIRIGGLEVDESESDVTVDGRKVRLTPIEHRILLFLVRNAGTTYSSTELYENIWGEIPVDTKNIVAVHIRHIREKIEIDPKNPRYVKVVWGRGYKIQSQTEN